MRLIDADAFDERIRLAVGSCEEDLTEDFKDGIQTVLEMMKTAPTVDAVPVVRCKDCKHHYYDRSNIPYCSEGDYAYGWKVTDMKPNDEVTITYPICAAAMIKMWIDDVLTDDEYNRIMDKLNAWELNRREGEHHD